MAGIDLKQQICNFVNSLDGNFHCKFGALLAKDSIVLNEVAGGQTTRVYMDDIKDMRLNYEFACKSKDIQKIELVLNKIAISVDNLNDLPSENNSYEFDSIKTTSMPFPSAKDESGYFIYRLLIQAEITTIKN